MNKIYKSEGSSRQRFSERKGILRDFAKFTGKHLCQSLLFNKVEEKLKLLIDQKYIFLCLGNDIYSLYVKY